MSNYLNDKRQEDKTLEDNAKGLVARSVKEGTPLTEMRLREVGEDRDAIIGLARKEFARLAGDTFIGSALATAGGVHDVFSKMADIPRAALEDARVKAAQMRRGEDGRLETSDGLPREAEGLEAGELSPEQVAFMGTLRARYKRNKHHLACHDSVAWAKVEAKLSANPAKLDALKRMDDSGGAPDVTEVEGEDFLFDDLAAKLPDSRRGVTYAQALARAEAMGGGAKLTRPERYKKLGNEMKIVMDTGNDWVWLDTSDRQDVLDAGHAFFGDQSGGAARVGRVDANIHFRSRAFRCSLRV